MLKPSEITNAHALIAVLGQKSLLPLELQTKLQQIGDLPPLPLKLQAKLQQIGNLLETDPSVENKAIQDGVNLISAYPELETAYQSVGRALSIGEVRKGLAQGKIDPAREFSQETGNMVRVALQNAGKQQQQKPLGFWDRLWGKQP